MPDALPPFHWLRPLPEPPPEPPPMPFHRLTPAEPLASAPAPFTPTELVRHQRAMWDVPRYDPPDDEPRP